MAGYYAASPAHPLCARCAATMRWLQTHAEHMAKLPREKNQ
jgi:hypothetical protein